MRAPFQILAIPYRIQDGIPLYCVFQRSDHAEWQFIAGGGEDAETPLEAAKREVLEEGGVSTGKWIELTCLSYISADCIAETHRANWSKDTFVIPEYTFGFECTEEVRLSHEHTKCVWLTYEDATARLKWDSNKTALYELNCRLEAEI